jgi:chromosome segregation ATPase
MRRSMELSSKELGTLADEIAHDARRYRARIAFAEQLASLKSLLGDEEAIRARVADLKRQADELAAIVAAADTAQARLENLQAEFATKEAAMMKRARADAEQIVREAWSAAESVELNAKRKSEEAARLAEEEMRRRREDIASLDKTLEERERRLASINAQIEKLRAKINDE